MATVLGPFFTKYDNPHTGVYITRYTWKTKPVTKDQPLTFIYKSGYTDRPDVSHAYHSNTSYGGGNIPLAELEAKVYERAVSKIKRERGSASLGTSIAEGRESLQLIARRSGQAFRLIRGLKNLRLGEAMDVINEFLRDKGMRPVRTKAEFRKKFRRPCRYSSYKSVRVKRGRKRIWLDPLRGSASSWLEYWLAWAPMVGDIRASMSVLEKDAAYSASDKVTATVKYSQSYPGGNSYSRFAVGKFVYSVRVTNPNHDLTNRLGLTNLASIAWDLVPLSFVVNYFADIGSWLNSFSDLAGMKITSSYYTVFQMGEHVEKRTVIAGGVQSQIWIRMHGIGVTRSVGYAPNKGGFNYYAHPKYGITSITRAATSVSLLISQIRY